MSKINQITGQEVFKLHDELDSRFRDCECLEEAAQKFTDLLYEKFSGSIALTRLFVTVPYGNLPLPNKAFVDKLAASAGIASSIKEQTLILSLVGTRGEKSTWNSRHDSEGHVGIPLASAAFVEEIPMVSRLLKEMGLGLEWLDSQDASIMGRKMGNSAGVFHVLDAKTDTDHRQRKIIAAQDFVEGYHIKTVFGIGGAYLYTNSNSFVVNINFTHDTIAKHQAERFLTLINTFKTATVKFTSTSRIFVGQPRQFSFSRRYQRVV